MTSVYEQKLNQARSAVEDHNSRLPEGSEKINADQFIASLKAAGGTSVQALADARWEDLQDCGLPRILARFVAGSIFRKKEEKTQPLVVTTNRAKNMSPTQLFEHYDHNNPDTPVGDRLKELSNDNPCVVLTVDETAVDVGESVKVLNDLREDYPPIDSVVVGEDLRRVWHVGERPDKLADENPLYPGEMLRSNGRCDHTRRSWDKIPMTIRQLVYLAVTETHEIVINSVDSAHSVMDYLLMTELDVAQVRQRYPDAALALQELERSGDGPRLKITRSRSHCNNEKLNNPFNR